MSMEQGGGNALGFEYQVLDSANHPDAQTERGATRVAGSLYDIMAPTELAERPIGEFNEGKVVFNGNHGEHWLNGIKVIEYELDSPSFDSLFQASKYTGYPGFAEHKQGHIILQDHNDSVWNRNIKLRKLSDSSAQ
jgi:hypothetical protein